MIIFLNAEKAAKPKQQVPGGLKGQFSIPDDGNTPLEKLKII